MGATTFTPLDLGLIDEGRFLEDANKDLAQAQQELARFVEEHGEAAKKSKAVVTLKVTLQCERGKPENEAYSVKAESKLTIPARLPSVTLALRGEDEADEPCLFVRRSGSTSDTPKQKVLATKDGRTVDPETGELLEAPAEEKH
jgi:hypothetical protein